MEPEAPLDLEVTRDLAALELGQIAIDVRAWEFARARTALESELVAQRDAEIRAVVAGRLEDVKGYEALLARLCARIDGGAFSEATTLPGMDVALAFTAADATGYQATVGRARVRERWTNLAYRTRWALLDRVAKGAEELWALACLSWEMSAPQLAERAAAKLWLADEGARGKVTLRLERERGESAGLDGYVIHDGLLVTPEAKAALERGLVRFRGKWVTPSDRQHLEKNHVQVDGQWTALTEDQMRRRGYVLYKSRWYTAEDYRALRGQWEHAWEHAGSHWLVRTNEGEDRAARLASALDQTSVAFERELSRALGKNLPPSPRDEPLLAYAFAAHDEYREWCRSIGKGDAAGKKGIVRKSDHLIAAWRWIDDDKELLRTLVHRAVTLAWSERFADPPWWLITGLAIGFEGFDLDEAKFTLDFHHAPSQALSTLRLAIANKAVLPLATLCALDVEALADDPAVRKVAPAQCWGLVHFLARSTDPRERTAWAYALAQACQGEPIDLARITGPDPEDFVRRWRNHVRRIESPHSGWLSGGCKLK